MEHELWAGDYDITCEVSRGIYGYRQNPSLIMASMMLQKTLEEIAKQTLCCHDLTREI